MSDTSGGWQWRNRCPDMKTNPSHITPQPKPAPNATTSWSITRASALAVRYRARRVEKTGYVLRGSGKVSRWTGPVKRLTHQDIECDEGQRPRERHSLAEGGAAA